MVNIAELFLKHKYQVYSQENASYISAGFISVFPPEKGFHSTKTSDQNSTVLKIHQVDLSSKNDEIGLKLSLAENPQYKMAPNHNASKNENSVGYNNEGCWIVMKVFKYNENWTAFSGKLSFVVDYNRWGIFADGKELKAKINAEGDTFHFLVVSQYN